MRIVLGVLVASLAGCGFTVSAQGDAAGSDMGPIDAPVNSDSSAIDATPDAASDSAVDAVVEKACPAGAVGFHGQSVTDAHLAINDHFFYFSSDAKHFTEAETACEGIGSAATKPVHLATPNSTEAPMVGNVQPVSYMWIGLYQLQNQATTAAGWVTVTGKTGAEVYVNWANGEPSDTNGSENNQENYVQMYGGPDGHPDGTMNDTSAGDNLNYICECDGDAAVP